MPTTGTPGGELERQPRSRRGGGHARAGGDHERGAAWGHRRCLGAGGGASR